MIVIERIEIYICICIYDDDGDDDENNDEEDMLALRRDNIMANAFKSQRNYSIRRDSLMSRIHVRRIIVTLH